MTVSFIFLVAMTVVVAVLAVYRSIVARKEDDYLHIADPSGQMVINQQKMASTLKQVDHYGVMLTVATAVYGVGFLAYFMYVGLQSGRM
jgi:hypothetical protein